MTAGCAGKDSQVLKSLQIGQWLSAQALKNLQTSVNLAETQADVQLRISMLEPEARDSRELQELYVGAAVASIRNARC